MVLLDVRGRRVRDELVARPCSVEIMVAAPANASGASVLASLVQSGFALRGCDACFT